ncbi:competence/damage-inducible protein CinA-like protein [Desulfocapsa sulfexigens DSM 10523]|uniref:CinA-like protein n=1 Tax=Desulfocapsa sulfexigens (strain DSM 10523 / SB164P1) TaxID=1167006 RepID=M1NAY9_DESSD|nr:CinA family nicotinamide mononucleotide deamidase-related protein [Desulfocapsa sulfexigens]AGF76969.1 competence/damage-inducible protein CinA-like protein [Desulfocapsa sulfexigens DSM 10523]
MLGEIIAIGNELTSGRIPNTTSGFAAHHLFKAGFDIYAMHTIGDTPKLIGEALKRALGRVDFVLVTGGLGTTDDDLTTVAVSEALNRPTMPNLEILSLIRKHLDANTGQPVSSLEKLAWLPEGAEALNAQSKMSGFQLIHDGKPIFFLPGIPHQMRTLLVEQVLPRLATWYKGSRLNSVQQVFKIFGIQESDINSAVEALPLDKDVEIGYYPVFPEVHLSMTIRGNNKTKTEQLAKETSRLLKQTLGSALYGRDQDTLQSVVGELLQKRNKKLSVAESCTGGLISYLVTSIAGSSAYYLGGVTSYADSMKTTYLDVDESTLKTYGAVSKEVATAMVEGMRKQSSADISLSVTGIAGPDGGSVEKPVGTVFIGIADQEDTRVERFLFTGNRYEIQQLTAQTALDIVRRSLLETE